MAFLVAGVWRTRGALPVPQAVEPEVCPGPEGGAAPTVGDGVHDAVPGLAARVAALHLDASPDEDEEKDDPASTARKAQFDWPTYLAVWQETPIDEAITAMFAEFAVLHAELCGYTCSTAPLPLTLDVGKRISERAERFVTLFLSPILAPRHSSKVHRLLCHVLHAIRMHGNINNGNAGINERMRKEDKPYYARTNKAMSDFTRQLVFQAQGAHVITCRNAEEDKALLSDEPPGHGDSDGEAPGQGLSDDDGALDGATMGLDSGPRPAEAPLDERVGAAAVSTPAYHLRRVSVSAMAQWPGMKGVAAALGLPEDAGVRVSSRISFEAFFECGWTATQLLYASPSFLGEPWYDFVLYSPSMNAATLSVTEMRAIVRRPEGDVAVVADMEVVPGVPNCPLVSRGCTRLAWSVPVRKTDVCLRTLPLASIRRVLHVVPEIADLASRRGLEATPADWGDPVADRLAMRYFINAFYPWGT